jgi:hypothetical protein
VVRNPPDHIFRKSSVAITTCGARPADSSAPAIRDANRTWLYVDPARGAIVQRTDETRRLRRWLYQGLRSLDFPALYYQRPLWDIVVIGLSIGGLAFRATALLPAWRRLRSHARGFIRAAPSDRRISEAINGQVGPVSRARRCHPSRPDPARRPVLTRKALDAHDTS